jgi:phage tail sheath gpL-like
MPDSIVFNNIPLNTRTPGAFVEIDPSRAVNALPVLPRKLLLIGQRFTAGTVAEGVPVRIHQADEAAAYFGRGSMLHRMARFARAASALVDIWAIALDDDAEGVKASGTLTFTGPATAAGTLYLYIAGQRLTVGVESGQTATQVGDAVAAAVNADTNLPVTAANAAGVVTLTCRWAGETGNEIDVRVNYYMGERLPAGIGVTGVAMAGGTANPDIAPAIAAAAGELWYSWIVPYTDGANMTALETELADRFGPMDPLTGHAFQALACSHANLTTWGEARNSPHVSCLGLYKVPTASYEVAAAWGVVCDQSGAADPARPFQTLAIPGMLPPAVQDRFTRLERNNLLFSGISTYTVDQGGVCRIERVVTTYQQNAQGQEDISFLDLETKWTVDYIRYAVRDLIPRRFPRFKLADDGTNFLPGQNIATPGLIRAELVGLFKSLEEVGLVEQFEQYKADLIVRRSETDPNRVNAVIPPNVVNQFRVFAAAVQFRL